MIVIMIIIAVTEHLKSRLLPQVQGFSLHYPNPLHHKAEKRLKLLLRLGLKVLH